MAPNRRDASARCHGRPGLLAGSGDDRSDRDRAIAAPEAAEPNHRDHPAIKSQPSMCLLSTKKISRSTIPR